MSIPDLGGPQGPPQMQPGVPMAGPLPIMRVPWAFNVQQGVDQGSDVVYVELHTIAGSMFLLVEPADAIKFGRELVHMGQAAKSGLVVPQSAPQQLIVPGNGQKASND